MSRDLTPDEQVLARATKQAIQAAGGLEVCERETGISDSQLSRCCSPNQRDSITIRDAVTIEQIGHGPSGHPHILRAYARILGFILIPRPEGPNDANSLSLSVMTLTAELGDVAQAINDAFRDDGECSPGEALRALEQLSELDQASATLRLKLNTIAEAGKRP